MIRTIYKFSLDITDVQFIEMPEGAQILSAQNQSGNISLWALVDVEKPLEKRDIRIYGTGHPYEFNDSDAKYISTVQQGPLAWHIFEKL